MDSPHLHLFFTLVILSGITLAVSQVAGEIGRIDGLSPDGLVYTVCFPHLAGHASDRIPCFVGEVTAEPLPAYVLFLA